VKREERADGEEERERKYFLQPRERKEQGKMRYFGPKTYK
jgi:hypothetical protein